MIRSKKSEDVPKHVPFFAFSRTEAEAHCPAAKDARGNR